MNLQRNLIITLTLLLSVNLLSAQQLSDAIPAGLAAPGWQPSDNWVYDYREAIGQQASLGWINDVLSEGAILYRHEELKGLLVIGLEENEDELAGDEFVMNPLFGGGLQNIYPNGLSEVQSFGSKIEWRGTLAGKEVVINRICIENPIGQEVLTFTSIVPMSDYTASLDLTLLSEKAVTQWEEKNKETLTSMAK